MANVSDQPQQVNPVLQQQARAFRKRPTRAEAMLWQALRNRQLAGAKFRRQFVCGSFIVDFCCPEHRLIIEVDGSIHAEPCERDTERSAYLVARHFRILRFTNDQIFGNLASVQTAIRSALTPVPDTRLADNHSDDAPSPGERRDRGEGNQP
jgi:5-methyltetrahydrofolate--homocysteine methyltransferase